MAVREAPDNTEMPERDAAGYRTCGVTGFWVHLKSQQLILFNAVTAVVFLAVGGVLALTLVLTRWQSVHLLSAERYYEFVTAHGIIMLVFWIVFFEVAGLYFGATVLLNHRIASTTTAWIAYVMMLGGAVLTSAIVFAGHGTVMFTAYPPLEAHPGFYAGLLLFAVGALIAVGLFLITVVRARMEGRVGPSLPLVTFGFVSAAIIAVFTLVSGALALIPALLWSLGFIPGVDAGVYRLLYWGFGHGAQQVNLAAMVAVWYALASLVTGGRVLNEGLSRIAFLLYILFINLGAMHHLLVDPGVGTTSRILNTSYFMYLAALASMIHAFSIPAVVETAQRSKGYVNSLFEWLRRAPWKEPGFAALAVSFVIFGFVAGTSGVIMGTMQINMLAHNTLIVPAHFHMTVVAGTTIAFMGITYYLLPLLTQKELVFRPLASIQPYFYGGGLLVMFVGMFTGGQQGVPRRHWDVLFADAPMALDVYATQGVDLSLLILGIGGILAVLGGAMFVIIAVATLLVGRKVETPYVGELAIIGVQPAGRQAAAAADETESDLEGAHDEVEMHAPGTLVLVFIFLAWFIGLYVLSWWNLSQTWPVS